MNVEIIHPIGDFQREVWSFVFQSNVLLLYLERFSFQTRSARRHRKWQTQSVWSRGGRILGEKIIERPTVPPEIEADLRRQLHAVIDNIQVK